MSFVAVDLGASSTRHVSNEGKPIVTPNYMAFLDGGESTRVQPDSDDVHSCLELTIRKEKTSEYFPANVVVGIMADRHTNLHDKPSVNKRKCLQRVNYVNAVLSVALQKLSFNIGNEIDLYIAVPPIEIEIARENFEKELVDSYKVTLPKYKDGTTVEFTIRSVSCFEESFMASTSFFFDMNGAPRDSSKKFLTGSVLSLDIGASTSDLAIIKNGRYLDRSGKTYRIGGIEARDYLISKISAYHDIDLAYGDAEKTMAEGRLQQGNSYEDCSKLVIESKQSLAKKLIMNMQTYFKAMEIDISTINAIVVSGGGSMQSQYTNEEGEVIKTSEPMSYFVTQELTDWSKGTEVVTYGEEARLANVKGLFIRAKVDEAKRAKKAAEASAEELASRE